MEWVESIRKTIEYLEAHLLEEEHRPDRAVGISPFYLAKGFAILTGYTMGEYVRDRRLYLAGLDVLAGRGKVIDIALRYGYDTPESFTKAFVRFHGVTPMQLRRAPGRLRIFLPLKISIIVQGGNDMDFIVEHEPSFSVIGLEKNFQVGNSYQEIPKFWDAFAARYMGEKAKETEEGKAVLRYGVGLFGICLDEREDGSFRYLIAGKYAGGPVPEGWTVHTFPAMDWAKFLCKGPLPGALQAVNTRIFREWLPGNPDYAAVQGCTVEWYSEGDPQAADYESAIWLPVIRRADDPKENMQP